ncbi:MAG: DUF2935 domain-containing protein, partial [Alicyclobacillus shizuokensis]|nr:DUF2935 domain-containing protein [Alicyclobacillus shizuokensis]
MKPSSPHDDALFEHRFWLQVLGDHARFIHTSLAPTEVTEIRRAQRFIEVFDSLLARARQNLHDSALTRLHTHAYKVAKRLREFKLHLLRRHLASEVEMSLSPSFLNHMVNENEEYLRIIGCWLEGQQTPLMNPLHHHQLWLQDAYGHSATLAQTVDFSEFDLKRKSDRFTHDFQALYLKAIELAGGKVR